MMRMASAWHRQPCATPVARRVWPETFGEIYPVAEHRLVVIILCVLQGLVIGRDEAGVNTVQFLTRLLSVWHDSDGHVAIIMALHQLLLSSSSSSALGSSR